MILAVFRAIRHSDPFHHVCSPSFSLYSGQLGTAVTFIKFVLPDFSDLCSTITGNLRPVPKSLDRCRNHWRTIIRNPPRVPKTPQEDKNPWGTFTENLPCVPNSQFMGINSKKSFLCLFKFVFCQLIRISQPYMWFLFVRPRICLQLPSDSTSQQTRLLFSYVLRRCLLPHS